MKPYLHLDMFMSCAGNRPRIFLMKRKLTFMLQSSDNNRNLGNLNQIVQGMIKHFQEISTSFLSSSYWCLMVQVLHIYSMYIQNFYVVHNYVTFISNICHSCNLFRHRSKWRSGNTSAW